MSGETDLRWIDARYQNADCLTKHASKSEAVLQKVLTEPSGEIQQKRTCWIDADKKERFVTVLRAAKNRGLRVNKQLVR